MNPKNRQIEKMQCAFNYMQKMHAEGLHFISPTMVGRFVGWRLDGKKNKHSSYGSPICKYLVENGYAERSSQGHYRLLDRFKHIPVEVRA